MFIRSRIVYRGVTVAYFVDYYGLSIVDRPTVIKLIKQNLILNARITKGNRIISTDTPFNTVNYYEMRRNYVIDVSNYKCESYGFSGRQRKILLSDSNAKYMIKFCDFRQNGEEIPTHISEFVSCKIAWILGYPAQQVRLVDWNQQEAVLIKMFNNRLFTLTGIGNSTMESEHLSYDLDSVDKLFENGNFDSKSIDNFWDVFLLDSFICNLDRHPNNLGFFKNNGVFVFAPQFDLGNSLFVDISKSNMKKDVGEIINKYGRSAIMWKGERCGFIDILLNNKNSYLKESIERFRHRLDQSNFVVRLEDVLQSVEIFNLGYLDLCNHIRRFTAEQMRRYVG
jgi:hypothetical protein